MALYLRREIQAPPKYLHTSNSLRFPPQRDVVTKLLFQCFASTFGLQLKDWGQPGVKLAMGSLCYWQTGNQTSCLAVSLKENTSDMKSFVLIRPPPGRPGGAYWDGQPWILNNDRNIRSRSGAGPLDQWSRLFNWTLPRSTLLQCTASAAADLSTGIAKILATFPYFLSFRFLHPVKKTVCYFSILLYFQNSFPISYQRCKNVKN